MKSAFAWLSARAPSDILVLGQAIVTVVIGLRLVSVVGYTLNGRSHSVGPGSILLVVHTSYEEHNEEVIRVIWARAAESHERRAYEEAHKGAEARHPSYRRKKRRGH